MIWWLNFNGVIEPVLVVEAASVQVPFVVVQVVMADPMT